MANADDTKLKILCLHGYRQNGQTFRERTGAFRKIIKSRAELVFMTAPNRVPPLPGQEVDTPTDTPDKQVDQMGWWFSQEDDFYMAQDYTDCCKGYKESLDTVTQVFQEQGPFDGVLAFSQGAAFLSLICALRERSPTDTPYQFDFAILVAGFKSRQSMHQDLYTSKVSLPSLHVFGDTDKVIQKEMSEELLPCYTDTVILQHPGGHFIPASGPQKKVYTQFLDVMLEKRKTRT
ncbi:esterase OVCA2-like [Mizuhopecten yessoensis]|uniref:Ovarian cancer-associated gene 2-like protein n=1 Tax=Mizuhopecten yessoensis TaxID=6573 RepID=A0A210QXS9_MIZYE|nr:esterase OVCA2-like [Mizuhopecten yessoensis]OWF53579.1 Ovarian cancer-associated gene 2-like protein [Mizuhopecten yessoensis]